MESVTLFSARRPPLQYADARAKHWEGLFGINAAAATAAEQLSEEQHALALLAGTTWSDIHERRCSFGSGHLAACANFKHDVMADPHFSLMNVNVVRQHVFYCALDCSLLCMLVFMHQAVFAHVTPRAGT